jgi:hypothetical protein
MLLCINQLPIVLLSSSGLALSLSLSLPSVTWNRILRVSYLAPIPLGFLN